MPPFSHRLWACFPPSHSATQGSLKLTAEAAGSCMAVAACSPWPAPNSANKGNLNLASEATGTHGGVAAYRPQPASEPRSSSLLQKLPLTMSDNSICYSRLFGRLNRWTKMPVHIQYMASCVTNHNNSI